MPKIKEKKESKKSLALVIPRDVQPQALIAQAITQGANVETMEKLMNLQDRWEAKQAKKAFDASMAEFQSECPVIKKTKAVKDNSGKVLYMYAPIEAIVSQVRPFLQKHGFSYAIKTAEGASGKLSAICIAKHKLGHSEDSTFEVPGGGGTSLMSGPQKTAAALTFAKRYAFCNAFGIMTGDEDIDANIGGAAPRGKAPVSDDDQLQASIALINKTNSIKTLQQFLKKVEANKDITAENRERILKLIDDKIITLKTNEGVA